MKQDIDELLSEENLVFCFFLKQRFYEVGATATKLLAWRQFIREQERLTNKIISNPDCIEKTNNYKLIQIFLF